MNKKHVVIARVLAALLINVGCAFSEQLEIELKPHEEWWEYNCETHGDCFRQWVGDKNAPSRVAIRTHVRAQKYESIIDVACGLCIDYDGFQADHMVIAYQGLDITPKLIKAALDRGVPARQGSIENIPLADCSFDIAYARHILEHLMYYENAVKELIRVAAKEVLIVFFIKPSAAPDFIDGQANEITQGYLLYHNVYNKEKLENYIKNFHKVSGFEWQEIGTQEIILHIYLKQ